MSDLEKLVRRRMQEEYAKGASAKEIAKVVRDLLNNIDLSDDGFDAVAVQGTADRE
ncbi:hypothetical protein [Rhizobium binae]|uniref:Uncharacterized protein n=1 Tax=Rhizobium binae TaxID=1138190 RepID=A0ABV2MBI8_9HYPH|nr:hypothetical protein [Rhizobium binae]MBX4946098.1 hypothetical protein [Rhizobium binae]MBX4981563.1 hypothetical protein [Rhizobium binae]QSY82779.1 hypothetical protein J2J99_02850 [Rhizobium binae]